MPQLENEIEGPLLPWLENLAWRLATLVIFFGSARPWRENSGAGADLFWWFGRVAIVFVLSGSGPAIVSKLDLIGQEIAGGGSGTSNNVLYRFYNNHRKSFEAGYRRFTRGHFTIEPTGEKLTPRPATVCSATSKPRMKMSDLKLAKEKNRVAGHELKCKYNKDEWNFCHGQPYKRSGRIYSFERTPPY